MSEIKEESIYTKFTKVKNAISDFYWHYWDEINSVVTVIFVVIILSFTIFVMFCIGNASIQNAEREQAMSAAKESVLESYNYTVEITGKSVDKGRFFFEYEYDYTYEGETETVTETIEVSESIFDSAAVGDFVNIKTLEVTSQIIEETVFSYFEN